MLVVYRNLFGDREIPEDRVLALQQVVHDDDGQEPERAEEQDHRIILREPSPAMGVISSGTVKSLADTLTRIMREGAVEGKTQEPSCGTNVVHTTF